MRVINLFGGPGCGKSTTAAGLFAKMKMSHLHVEYVQEYAKDLLYEDRTNIMASDQLYILAKQHRRLYRLNGAVDYAICDSPLILASVYFDSLNNIYDPTSFHPFVVRLFNSYDNLNVFLTRGDFPYEEDGRMQKNMDEAKAIDTRVRDSLVYWNIPFVVIKSDDNSVDNIFKML